MEIYKRLPILRYGIIMAILLIIPIVIKQDYVMRIIVYSLLWSIGAMGWNLLAGYAGQVSFGHQVYFGLAGYLSALLYIWYGISPWISLILGSVLGMAFGLAIGYPCFRLRGPYFSLATMSFPLIVQVPFLYYFSELGGSGGCIIPFKGVNDLWNLQFTTKLPWYYLSLGFVLSIIYLVKRIERSKLGHYLIAIREDEDAAECIGINAFKYKMVAIAISAFITGTSGPLITHFISFTDPYTAFGFSYLIEIILICIIGGMGTVFGPILGSIFLVPIGETIKYFFEEDFPGIHLIIYGIALMIVVIAIPEGIIVRIREMLKRK